MLRICLPFFLAYTERPISGICQNNLAPVFDPKFVCLIVYFNKKKNKTLFFFTVTKSTLSTALFLSYSFVTENLNAFPRI